MLTHGVRRVAGSSLIALVLAYLVSNADTSAHPPFPDVTGVMTNATGAPANHLKVEGFGVTLDPVQSNAPGCPSPTIHLNSLIPISTWVIAWPEECVDPGESITFHTDIDCTDCGSPYVSNYQFSSTFATLTNTRPLVGSSP